MTVDHLVSLMIIGLITIYHAQIDNNGNNMEHYKDYEIKILGYVKKSVDRPCE